MKIVEIILLFEYVRKVEIFSKDKITNAIQIGINPKEKITDELNDVFPTSNPRAIPLIAQKSNKDWETIKQPTIVVIKDQVPNSSAVNVLVIIKMNIRPVKTVIMPMKNANSPEY